MRAWKAQPLPKIAHVLLAPDHISTRLSFNSNADASHLLPEVQIPFEAGEQIAQQKLRLFVDGDDPPVYRYRALRNQLDLQGTSGLSPYLRFGMLSARQVIVSALASIVEAPHTEAEQSANAWLDELIWRDFYQSVLYHFPSVLHQSFRENYRILKWSNEMRNFVAWKQGQTGYPLVDAGMRQLQEIGWMHNRVRMRDVPPENIHEPWKMPQPLQRKIGCRIGVEYPRPIVEVAWSRQRALEAFGQVKHQAVVQGA